MTNRFSDELNHFAIVSADHCEHVIRSGVGAHCMSYSEFLGLNLGLLGNENSIKELTLILAADAAHLLNLGAALGKGSVVNAIEDELALDVSGLLDGGASLHLDNLVLLATEEVLDSDL